MSNTTSWVKSIFAVTLFTEDLDATKAFYQRVFELPIVFEGETSAVFKFGETLINLLKVQSAPELVNPEPVAAANAGARHVFTIHVDDVDAQYAELQAKGVKFSTAPVDRPWGIRAANFKDPAGNIWEIAK